jgi:hypothetical protein
MANSERPKTQRVIDRHGLWAKLGYEPHNEQRLFHNSKARFRVPVCGRRFGKSWMAGHDLEPKLFLPNKMYWIVGPTYDLAEKEFRVIWNDLIVKMQMGKDKRIKKAYNKKQGNMYIEMPWQTRLEARSADHPENLVGEALDHAIMSEAAKHRMETWERFIRPSLTDRRGGADFPTTPEGFNWLHKMWQFGQNPEFRDFESWRFPSWANSAIYPEGRQDPEILLLERTTTKEWFDQEIGADFASFVGKILPEWDEMVHVGKVEFNPNLPNYITFDWGYTNPLAAVEFQITPDDQVRIWRCHYRAFTTLADHIHLLKNREQPEGYHLDLAFGDPADPEAAATVSRELVPCVADPKVKSDYTWREGIELIRMFMKPRESTTRAGNIIIIDEYGTPAEDIPGMLVDWSCVDVIREFNNYRSREPIKGQNVPELGHKMEDHTIDALRYALIYLYKLGATSSLSDVYPSNNNWADNHSTNTTSGSELVLNSGLSSGGDGLGSGFSNLEGMEF